MTKRIMHRLQDEQNRILMEQAQRDHAQIMKEHERLAAPQPGFDPGPPADFGGNPFFLGGWG